MQIGIVGINHKQADLKLREEIARAFQRCFSLQGPEGWSAGFVLLSTCNRSELYFSSKDLAVAHQQLLTILRQEVPLDFEQKCYSFFGKDCFTHLAKVTAGLDSAIIAETEIQGQVKCAYEEAHSTRTLPSELHFLFQKALKIGKEVRSRCLSMAVQPDLEHAICHLADHHLDKEMPSLLFIGLSQINMKIARFIARKKCARITLCNRTESRAIAFAQEIGCDLLSWPHISHRWDEFDWVIAASRSPGHVITTAAKSPNKKLLIDLAVPRNICPTVHTEQCQLLNIDDLQALLNVRRLALKSAVERAELLIGQACERLLTPRPLNAFNACCSSSGS